MNIALILLFVSVVLARPKWHQLDGYSFEKYYEDFNKFYPDSEIEFRRAIFDKKLSEIKSHNANPSYTWKEGVNHLTDLSDQEFSRMLGYNKQLGYKQVAKRSQIYEKVDISLLPTSVDWRQKVPSVVSPVKDQGMCGSCWTFATTQALESHYAIATGVLQELSEQAVLDCTPNPSDCGGTGGCEGGTVELAYSNILTHGYKGLPTEWMYPYLSYWGKDQPACLLNNTRPAAFINGYVVLPSNQYDPLVNAVATKGPIAISVDASAWSKYETGVYNGCNATNPDIDHAVILVGFGTDSALGDYWLVKNSWSASFGEEGYIRLARSSKITCGVDLTPGDGDACDNDKTPQIVCGTCGILFDTAYPIISNTTSSN